MPRAQASSTGRPRWHRAAPTLRGLAMGSLRLLGATVAVWLLGTLLAVGDIALRAPTQAGAGSPAAAQGWGSEALAHVAEDTGSFTFIGIANACGLGTSSCARCHDGKRAPAPAKENTSGPWHRDHARVAYSCVGCHEGNPRVLREDVAHRKLIAAPLAAPDKHCKTCHKSAEIAALAGRYLPHSTSSR